MTYKPSTIIENFVKYLVVDWEGRYQPCNERVYPLFVCAAEVERHTNFQLPVTYRAESGYLKVMLLIR